MNHDGHTDPGEGLKESSSLVSKGSEGITRGLQSSGDRLHSLKVPQAVVAFAQAAAKANGFLSDLPGWPLLSPSLQMQKCDKCSREFCSPLNHRRHVRIHRRSLNADKDLSKERSKVAAYWNKLTSEEASNIISIKNIMIEDLSGTSAVRALASYLQQHSLPSLPQPYLKAGTALLEIVQNKASRIPIPAEELMSILDDASERMFLCGGTSSSVQRFLYRGDARKVGLEDRNLVASLGFLVEHKIVKAWMAERDAEALRCQKALVEEEEAAQQKRAKLIERKRMKKIRQKEVKERERKGTECQLVLQIPDTGSLGDEVGSPRTVEEDDLPSASGSSSSSVVSSGRDFTESELPDVEMNEIIQHLERPYSNGFTILAGEEHDVVWERYHSKDNVHSLDDKQELESVAKTNDVTETCEMEAGEKGVTLERGDPKIVAETKLLKATRERKKPGYTNLSLSLQKPRDAYESERRFYQGASHLSFKPARRSYTSFANTMKANTEASFHDIPYFSRLQHYRRRTSGMRNMSTGNTHAVWARKVQKSTGSEESKTDDKEELSMQKTSEDEVFVRSSQVSSLGVQDAVEDLHTVESYDTQVGFSSADDSMEGLESARALLTATSNSTSSIRDVQSDDVPYLLHSLYVNTSCNDSTLPNTGNAMMGKKNQTNPTLDSMQAPQLLSEPEMKGKEVNCCPACLSQPTQDAMGKEMSGGLLLVGSLSVPFGNYGLETHIHMQRPARTDKDSQCQIAAAPSQELEDGGICDSRQQITSYFPASKVLSGSGKDVPSFLPEKGADAKLQSCSNPSLKPPRSPLSGVAIGGEHTGKQGSWLNGFYKVPTLKVWRAIGRVGERHEDLVRSDDTTGESLVVRSLSKHARTTDDLLIDEASDGSYSAEVDSSEGSVVLYVGSIPDQQLDDKNDIDTAHYALKFRVDEFYSGPDRAGDMAFTTTESSGAEHYKRECGNSQDDSVKEFYTKISSCEKSVPLNARKLANFLSERWATAIEGMDTISAPSDGVSPSDSINVHSFLGKLHEKLQKFHLQEGDDGSKAALRSPSFIATN
ncbi:hypothetical protein O6H91_02G011300 [Diphasiastrum complanatum]|nr:hypothetical protein O6H91_02G011300 [Diphasiastrum complanatum]